VVPEVTKVKAKRVKRVEENEEERALKLLAGSDF